VGCPFYHKHVVVDEDVRVESACCALDGREAFGDQVLDIKLGVDGKRGGDCPFIDPLCRQIEVGCYE
ncbi:MAG: hypothetical protein KAY24_19920, partial [Candidatus Eisenbacteria sp.]|nr:hypothetical protein [Candidatus Eisenbacteria bacterium]